MSNRGGLQDSVSVDRARLTRPRYCRDAALREFDAEVELIGEDADPLVIGSLGGWLSWRAWLPECSDTGHAGCRTVEHLAATAVTISDDLATTGADIQAVVVVDHVRIGSEPSDRALSREIAEELIDLLLLTPETTLVMAHVPSHDLDPAYDEAGFRQWRSGVWWLPPEPAAPWRP